MRLRRFEGMQPQDNEDTGWANEARYVGTIACVLRHPGSLRTVRGKEYECSQYDRRTLQAVLQVQRY